MGCRVERHPTESPGGFEGDETVKGSAVKYIRWGIAAVGLLLLLWIVIDSDTRAQFVTGSGIAQGALVAAIALGVVLTYRGSGVVNFANSAIAMYIAYVYAVLRKEGDLFLPPLPNPFAPIEGVVHWFQDTDTFDLPDWPTRISFGPNMQFWPAMLISLIFAILLGLILHFLIFRPLRSAPPLAKVVASIGLFLYLPAVIIRRFTIQPYTVKPMPFFFITDGSATSMASRFRHPTATHGFDGTNWKDSPCATTVTFALEPSAALSSKAATVPPRPAPSTAISGFSMP